MKAIFIVTLLYLDGGNRLFLVNKRGEEALILPGGKFEDGEDTRQTLVREVREELDCTIRFQDLVYHGVFVDHAHADKNKMIAVMCYSSHQYYGILTPSNEIEATYWYDLEKDDVLVSPSLQNHIIPYMRELTHDKGNK